MKLRNSHCGIIAMNLHCAGRCEKSATCKRSITELNAQARRWGEGEFEKIAEQAEFVQHLHGGRMDRVAAEVAQEVRVFFEHDDVDAGTGQQQAKDHPAGPPPAMQHLVVSIGYSDVAGAA